MRRGRAGQDWVKISPRLSHILPGTLGDLKSRQSGSPCPTFAVSQEPVLQAKKIRGGWSTGFLPSHFRRGKNKGECACDEALAPTCPALA